MTPDQQYIEDEKILNKPDWWLTPEGRAERDQATYRMAYYLEVLAPKGVTHGNHCPACNGAGSKTYGSTSTWRGGIGGAAMTVGVCDKCWGSGDKNHPGINLRQYEKDMHELNRLRNAQKETNKP